MKIYLNKLYSIPDALKRIGLKESDQAVAIKYDIIDLDKVINNFFIRGKDIPDIGYRWKKHLIKMAEKKKALGKDPIKNTKVTILRMDKED